MLQIIDVASNIFIGNLPILLLSTWMAIMDRAHDAQSEPSHLETYVRSYYYQDTVTVTSKRFRDGAGEDPNHLHHY